MTNTYDYFEAVKEDAKEWLLENCETGYLMTTDDDEIVSEYIEDLFVDDNVTGNASGSYTFCTYTAQENLVGNWELLMEALYDMGASETWITQTNPEELDVFIRCYLLSPAMYEAIEEIKEEM